MRICTYLPDWTTSSRASVVVVVVVVDERADQTDLLTAMNGAQHLFATMKVYYDGFCAPSSNIVSARHERVGGVVDVVVYRCDLYPSTDAAAMS